MAIKSSQTLVSEALTKIKTIKSEDALKLSQDNQCNLIDIRDIRELQSEGRIENSKHIPRGMIEFWLDPDSPYFKKIFDEKKRFLFHCKADWRSALTVQTVITMGLENAAHIKGGLTAWCEAGGPFSKAEG